MNPVDELCSRHNKEHKDLQGQMVQKKKNATKKTRKSVNDECEKMQSELQVRHRQEIDALTGKATEGMGELELEDEEDADTSISPADVKPINQQPPNQENLRGGPATNHDASKKPNRQKARLARRAAEQEAQAAQAAEEAAQLPDLREQELSKMREYIKHHDLEEVSIRPDGHCMYSALAFLFSNSPSLPLKSGARKPLTYQTVRAHTADFISLHPDDFAAFLEEPIDRYTHKIKHTAEWGGQLELQAIARSYNIRIRVIQADGRVESIEPEGDTADDSDAVWLAYYRHSFGLGEHYNALRKVK